MFTLYKRFLDDVFCDYIAQNYVYFSQYTPRHFWHAYTIDDKHVLKAIETAFSPIIPKGRIVTWCNLTQYTKGRFLPSHRDEKSSLTIVSNITEGYKGGRFILNDKDYMDLNKGDVIAFNGSEVLHGVEEVEQGERLSLNLWTSDPPSKI